MPISTEVENKQRKERSSKIRDTISNAVRATEKPNKPIELEDKPKAVYGDITPYELDDDGSIKPARSKGQNPHWGTHLLLDFSKANKKIDDETAIASFFKQLFKELKLKPLSDLVIKRALPEEGRGLSACQLLTTSSVTLHTDDVGMDGYLDCFVCRPFDYKKVIKLVKEFFDPEEMGIGLIYRDAKPYPRLSKGK